MNDLLFVYGTLQSGFDNEFARLLADNSALVGIGEITACLYDLGSYPAACINCKEERVWGELYQCMAPDRIFHILDQYEGDEYSRELVEVQVNDTIYQANVYLYNHDPGKFIPIPSGNYKMYKNMIG